MTTVVSSSFEPHRQLLFISSLAIIGLVSQSWGTPVFVATFLTLNYFTLAYTNVSPEVRRILLYSNWTVLPIGFFLLQINGYIGVLSSGRPLTTANSVWMLGLPFYFLSVLSLNHEIQSGKLQRPRWLDYVLYGVYFPKFLSGPLEQPALLQKLSGFRFTLNREAFASGSDWLVLGLFCKFIIAHYLAKNVHAFELVRAPSIFLSVCAFELQVYFDLSGYSFMAIGISEMLGIPLTNNFAHPFFAGNIGAFWRRWHISLGRWFHQYVYTPVRALDPSSPRIKLFLPLLVFLLSAAWHGITLNFLVWGLWHGLAYLAYMQLFSRRKWPVAVAVPSLVFVLVVGRFLFMEPDFHALMLKLSRLLSWTAWSEGVASMRLADFDIGQRGGFDFWIAATLSGSYLLMEYLNQKFALPAYAIFRQPKVQWALILLGLLLIEGGTNGFIYARQ